MTDIELSRADGKRYRAYLATPARGKETDQGVVVLHEMWGLAPTICRIADRFAEAGYHAIVPDLFDGRRPTDLPGGFAAMGQLDMRDAVDQNVRSSVEWLAAKGLSAAVAGLCMGGALAILAGLHVQAVSGVVCFYGIPDAPDVDPALLRVPFIGHFARTDNWCTPGRVDALEARLRAGEVNYELHRYDEGHAFMNTEGPTYSERSDSLAWGRTLDFLARLRTTSR